MTKQITETQENGDTEIGRQTSGNNRIVIILFLISMLVFGAAGYYLWSELEKSRKMLSEITQTANVTSSGYEKTINKIQDSISELTENQESLSNTLAAIQQQESFSNEDMALAEIEYLLVLAMHRLQLEQDINTALVAMQAAERRLKDMGNSRLDPVREQINRDVELLQNAPVVDLSGLAAYLADLITRVDSLPLRSSVISEKENTETVEKSGEINWSDFPALVWNELKGLVVIKRHEGTASAILLEREKYYLYQNLRLELENARLSVLLSDSENLTASLVIITDWLNSYFDTDNIAVINILETLDQMATVDLGPELPDISSSLESLRAYLRASENTEIDNGTDIEEPVL